MTTRLERARAALAAAEAAASAEIPPPGARGVWGSREEPASSGTAGSANPAAGPDSRRVDSGGRRPAGPGRGRRVAPRGGDLAPDERDPADASAPPRDADPEALARQIVLRQLAAAPRSRAQLEDKLAARGCDDEVAARVLDRMAEVGLVDDAAYAETIVRSQRETRGLARRGLRHELDKRGVARDVADDALAAVDDAAERSRAEDLVAARLPRLAGLPRDVQTRRLASLLARKGYPAGLAYSVVQEALSRAPEHRRD